ncbi:MAG: hypothetical protein ACI4MP_02545 [Candidatus Ventricola sp.]
MLESFEFFLHAAITVIVHLLEIMGVARSASSFIGKSATLRRMNGCKSARNVLYCP